MRPGAIAIFAGGIVLLLSSFLDWIGSGPFGANAWEGAFFGLTGFFIFLIAAVCIAVGAIRLFAPQVKLPTQVLTFTQNQIVLILGFAPFVLAFSLLFRESSAKIGTILALLASAAIAVGAFLEDGAAPSSAAPRQSGPPQPF